DRMSAVDVTALERLTELSGDREFVRSLLTEFRTEAASLVAQLRQDDSDTVRRNAHSLKSAAASVGLTRLSAAAAELERAASGADGGQLVARVADVEREWPVALTALERLRDW
ncbi:MAG: Hpt domain-containing protein, partial [Actinomycetota bacterium]